MAFTDTTWYCNFGDGATTGYYAVTAWSNGAVIAAGALRRQLAAPAVGSERVFICIVAGTTGGAEPAWTTTRGAKTTDNTVTWQECTGASAVNGDVTNTPNWTTVKNTSVSLGQIIKRDNAASYQICSTAGTAGNGAEPGFSDTAGTTTADNTVTWTSLGVVGNFTGGQAPHARLQAAVTSTWFAGGNTIFVGDNHAETQAAAMTITGAAVSAGTQQNRILCHNHSGSYPPAAGDLTTGATISTTGANNITIGSNNMGGTYWYGLTFKAGSAASGASILISIQSTGNTWGYNYFDNCSFQLNNSSAASVIVVGVANQPNTFTWNNCKVKFGNVAAFIALQGSNFFWKNTGTILESGSSIPTTLFQGNSVNSNNFNATLEGLDLSQITTNIALGGQLGGWNFLIKDCKLNASLTPTNPGITSVTIQYVRCDSGNVVYTSSRYKYEGTETTEITITRVGTLAEPAANQAQSRKIVTTANVVYTRPFLAEGFAIWNNGTGSAITLTLYGTINSASLPNNDEIWMEVEYLGDASFPLGSFISTSKTNVLSAAAAVSSDGSTWNGGGSGAGWSPFKLAATFTPRQKGWIFVRPKVAKVSTTYYLDPVPVLS